MSTALTTYTYPRIAPRSRLYALKTNGQSVTVLHTDVADFVAFECDGEIEVEVTVLEPTQSPLKGVKAARLPGTSPPVLMAGCSPSSSPHPPT